MSRKQDDLRREQVIRGILEQAQSRRQFLGRSAWAAGGLALGGGLLAACAKKEEASASATTSAQAPAPAAAATAPANAQGPLRISNWPFYIDEKTVPDFQAATGIQVVYNEDINDNNEFFAKIDEPLKRNQSIDRDIVVLTDWMAARMIASGYCAPFDDAKFPNKKNLVPELQNVSFDPGRKFSVPWVSGMAGLG